jgi:hypothetical protein
LYNFLVFFFCHKVKQNKSVLTLQNVGSKAYINIKKKRPSIERNPLKIGLVVPAVTTALPGVPVQFKNRNPFINEEMNVNRPVPTLVAESSSPAPVYVTPMATEAAAVEERAATEEAEVAVSSAAPPEPEEEADSEPHPTNESTPSAAASDGHKLTEESTPAEAPQPTKEAEEVVNGGTHPIPPWIPDSKQEDADRLVLTPILSTFNATFTNSVYDLALYLRSDYEFCLI